MNITIKNIQGNLLDTDANIICHQVNCLGVMGAGIALQIKKRWPDVYSAYVKYCKNHQTKEAMLGKTLLTPGKNNKHFVANIFSQCETGTAERQTDYDAIKSGIRSLFAQIYLSENFGNDITIVFPKNYGCGLGGGDWNIVEQIIVENCSYYAYKSNINLNLIFVEFIN